MPPLYKVTSVSYHQTLEVALLSALTFGATIYFFLIGINYTCAACDWACTIAGAFLSFFFQLYLYKRLLLRQSKENNHAT
jgi:hypothetical protein